MKKYKISFFVICLFISSLNYCPEKPKNVSVLSNILSFFYQKFDALCKFIFFKNFLQFRLDNSFFCKKEELPKLTSLYFGTKNLTVEPTIFSISSETKQLKSEFDQLPKEVNAIIANFLMQLDRQNKDASSIARINTFDQHMQRIFNNLISQNLNSIEKQWIDEALLHPGWIGNKKEIFYEKSYLVCSCIQSCCGKINIYNNSLELIKTFNKVSGSGLLNKRSIMLIRYFDTNKKERIIFYDINNNKNFELPFLFDTCFSISNNENMMAVSSKQSLTLYDISNINDIKKISTYEGYIGEEVVFSQDDTLLASLHRTGQTATVYLFSLDNNNNQLKKEAHCEAVIPEYSHGVEIFFMNNKQYLGLSFYGRFVICYLNFKINKIKDTFEIKEEFRRDGKCVVARDDQGKLIVLGTSPDCPDSIEDCDGNVIMPLKIVSNDEKICKISRDGKYVLDINTTKKMINIVHLDDNHKVVKKVYPIEKKIVNARFNKDASLILASGIYQKESLTREYMLYDLQGNEIKSWLLPNKKETDVFFHPSGPIIIKNGDIYNTYDHCIDQKIKEGVAQKLTVEYYSQLQ